MKKTGKDKLNCKYIQCPKCLVTTKADMWEECEVGCEDCGSHDGLRCPNCSEEFDHVWGFEELIKKEAP